MVPLEPKSIFHQIGTVQWKLFSITDLTCGGTDAPAQVTSAEA